MEAGTESFGTYLRRNREGAGLSQDQVAALARVSKAYVSAIERDAPHQVSGAPPQPGVEIVDRLARAVGVPLAEARARAGYAPPPTEVDPLQTALLIYFNELSNPQKQTALALLQALWRSERQQKTTSERPPKHHRRRKTA